MGNAVVHFEIMGGDAAGLRSFYGELFDWSFDTDNPVGYGIVPRDGNTTADGIGIGGGVGSPPDGTPSYATFYVEVPDVEAALARAEELGATRLMGPMDVMGTVEIGLFNDPEGNMIGVVKTNQPG